MPKRVAAAIRVNGSLRRYPHPVTGCARAAASGSAIDPDFRCCFDSIGIVTFQKRLGSSNGD